MPPPVADEPRKNTRHRGDPAGDGVGLMAALVFLYLAITMGWLPASVAAVSGMPRLMLTSTMASAGMVILSVSSSPVTGPWLELA